MEEELRNKQGQDKEPEAFGSVKRGAALPEGRAVSDLSDTELASGLGAGKSPCLITKDSSGNHEHAAV